jgi:ABC-type transport system involved in multi-copper enzyme maturation permease subunit
VGRPWGLALAWKDFHFVAGGRMMIVGRFVGMFVLLMIYLWLASVGGERRIHDEDVGAMLMVSSLVVAALDLAGYVAKMFRCEIQWHTLPDLMLLPLSTRQLAWSKFVGVFPALVPYAVVFFIGALMCPQGFGEGIEGVLGTVYGWHFICQYIAFLSFTAYFSLLLKRAGAPVAFAIWLVGNQVLFFFLAFFMFRGPESIEGVFFLLAVLFIVFAIVCYRAAMARLERMAGE